MVNSRCVIIVLNWNGKQHLDTCLRSVFSQRFDSFGVLLVDNGSTDGSVDFVRQNFPEVEVIALPKNLGFAEGNNVGIRRALKDESIQYIVTLNNDTEVAPDWLEQLVAIVERDKKIGAVCSKMLYFQERNKLDAAGDYLQPGSFKVVTRGHSEIDQGQYDTLEECFSARAGAALYRREMLEDISLDGDYFDRHYFAYIEDTDLSIRARLRGWKIMYAPASRVYHKVAATSNTVSDSFRRYQSGRNRLFTAIKDLPVSSWLASVRGRESIEAGYRFSFWKSPGLYGKILVSTMFSLPRLIRQRATIQSQRLIIPSDIMKWRDRFTLPGHE